MGQSNILRHAVVSFYGFTPKFSTLGEFYLKSVDWFTELERPPRYMGSGIGKGLGDYSRKSKRVIADGFSIENTQHITLRSLPFKPDVPAGPCDVECGIRANRRPYAYFSVSTHLLKNGLIGIRIIAKEIASLVDPSYGIGFTRNIDWGPVFFALGIGVGVDNPIEDDKSVVNLRETVWEGRYNNGNLGGIFPWNFLTAPQLHAKVGNLTLEHWIREKPHRGTLESLTDKIMLWAVPEEDIPAVYQALWEAEVVFDYERHCDRMARMSSPTKPMTAEQALGQAMKAFGYESAKEAQVFQVQESKNLKEVPTPEVDQALRKTRKPRKK